MTQDEIASLHLDVRLCVQQVPINIGFENSVQYNCNKMDNLVSWPQDQHSYLF